MVNDFGSVSLVMPRKWVGEDFVAVYHRQWRNAVGAHEDLLGLGTAPRTAEKILPPNRLSLMLEHHNDDWLASMMQLFDM